MCVGVRLGGLDTYLPAYLLCSYLCWGGVRLGCAKITPLPYRVTVFISVLWILSITDIICLVQGIICGLFSPSLCVMSLKTQ